MLHRGLSVQKVEALVQMGKNMVTILLLLVFCCKGSSGSPATLAPGEWEESQWASNATVRPDPRPVWQKSVEPPKKDWNDFVWSAEKVRACDKP